MKTFSLSMIPPGVRALFDILPDSLIERLLEIGDQGNLGKFEIAFDTIELVDIIKAGEFFKFSRYKDKYPDGGRPPVSVMDVYEFMSLATRGLAAPRTIRYWSDVIRKFPVDLIRQYGEVLPFDHFAVAIHATNPREAIELAMAQTVANEGIPPTADWLVANMTRTAAHPELPEYPPDYISPERLESERREQAGEVVGDIAETGEAVGKWIELYNLINEIRRATERITDQIARGMYSTPDPIRERLARIIEFLEEVEGIDSSV